MEWVYKVKWGHDDQAAYKDDENRRWVLIDSHYDLPIKEIDPHATDE